MVLSHGARGEVAERATVDDIRIRVLVDNARGATGLQQWGLSFWIETPAAQLRIRELAGADDLCRELIAAMQGGFLECFEQLALRPGLALQEQKRLVARQQALLFAKAPLCMAVLTTPHDSPMEKLMRLDVVSPTRLVALAPTGRSAELPAAHKRRPLEQVLSFPLRMMPAGDAVPAPHGVGRAVGPRVAPVILESRLVEPRDVGRQRAATLGPTVGRGSTHRAPARRPPGKQAFR